MYPGEYESVIYDLQDRLEEAERRELELLNALMAIDSLVKSDPDMSGKPRWSFQPSMGARVQFAINKMKKALGQ